MMEIVFIVAIAENGVIGADGTIPWRLKSRQERFKAITIGKPIVMGRKTFVSSAGRCRAHQHRRHPRCRLSRRGRHRDDSFADAYDVARGDALRRSVAEIVVIGGAEIYAQWIDAPTASRSRKCTPGPTATRVLAAIDGARWDEVARVRHPAGPDDSADFSYVTYRRRRPH